MTKTHALETLKHCLHPIWHLLQDDDVEEVMVNAPNDVWVESKGRKFRSDVSISERDIDSAIQTLAHMNKRDAKESNSSALIDARLPGFRVAATLQPFSVRGASICIRKHNPQVFKLSDFVERGTLSQANAEFLATIVSAGKNILIVGGTSSGKTTFMNALIAHIPEEERVLSIEDTHELKITTPNRISFEANSQKGVTSRDLLKHALRYNPDRILVGEVRGPESFDLLQAANTGHDGLLATLHASGGLLGLSRMESLVLTADTGWPYEAIKKTIADVIHYVLFINKNKEGKRQLEQIIELNGYNQRTDEYLYNIIFEVQP